MPYRKLEGPVSRLAAGMAALLAVLLAGCAGQAAPAQQSPPFLDVTGQCPVHPDGHSPGVCQRSRQANAVAGIFKTRHGPWGFAYSYNCGAKPGTFFVIVGLPVLDGQLVASGVMRTGRKGTGYQFVSPSETTYGTQGTPSIWVSTESVQMLSTCAWHVRAVAGTAQAVKRAIPPIPTSVNETVAEQGAKQGYGR